MPGELMCKGELMRLLGGAAGSCRWGTPCYGEGSEYEERERNGAGGQGRWSKEPVCDESFTKLHFIQFSTQSFNYYISNVIFLCPSLLLVQTWNFASRRLLSDYGRICGNHQN